MNPTALVCLLALLITVGHLVLLRLDENAARERLRRNIDEYRRAFPDGCFVCSYERWCDEHGVDNEIGQFPHRCAERLRALRGER